MNYISINLYKKMINHALAEGLSRDEFIDLPTKLSEIDKIDAVPADHFFYLHEFLEQKIDAAFSVRVGSQMKIEDYGVLGMSWRTCSWAGEIFERSERYFKLLSNTYEFKVEKNDENTIVYLDREPHRRGLELSNEATLSATVVVLQAITEKNIYPIEVSFKHSSPKNIIDHQKAFSCKINFDKKYYSITYKTSDFETRTAKADKMINNYLTERVEEQTKGIEKTTFKLINDLESLIKNALPSGIPSVSNIGKTIGMSQRTLTRRLAESGFSYRDLLTKIQVEISKDLLKNSKRSIAEIAFETGFSEQSAFNRAFKRWTNSSPIEYRKYKK